MKLLICICAGLITMAKAMSYEYVLPTTKLSAPLIFSSVKLLPATVSQFHTQDALGQYTYGYTEPLSTKQETRTADGVTRGTYSYLDAVGKTQTVDYTADIGGFRVAATNLLKPVEETAEVAALRAQHLAAHDAVKLRLADNTLATNNLPQPVQDTPEVAAAKVEFFRRYEAEKLHNKLLSEKAVLSPKSVLVSSAPIYVKNSPLALVPISGFGYNFKIGGGEPPRQYLPLA